MLEKFVIQAFEYYKQEVINEDLFDSERDEDSVISFAISMTASALGFNREYIEGIINNAKL